ncbi:MAG: 1-deoxy-D-xylulose-5-phosphate synthase, partial [Clostridia bacterium]|nr:1-deoxy-D-xylulose-5-phosphate synthase [Clostridia bacterium]
MLERIRPEQIHNCTRNELNVLCDELRRVIYDTVTACGGHLASNLGSVESTVAMFHTFDFPKDKVVFDVG